MLTAILLQSLFLLVSSAPAENVDNAQISRVKLRLEEAKTGGVYLTLSEDQFVVSIRNLDLKSLPIQKTVSLGDDQPAASKIAQVVAASNFKRVVKEVESLTVDTTGSVDSVDEIQSVEDMPASFLITLENGSYIWVQNSEGIGIFDSFRAQNLQIRALLSYWWYGEEGVAKRAFRIKMAPEEARHLFWLARPGTQVIY